MTEGVGKFDKLSNLARELESIEQKHAQVKDAEITQARSAVVSQVSKYRDSRFQLGRVLRNYKAQYRADGGWVAAAKIIGEVLNRDERTVFRIIDDYERASKLPQIVIEAMEAQKLDPAAPKNAGIVGKLAQMPEPSTRKKADSVVARMHTEHTIGKKVARAAKNRDKESLEEFAKRILCHFQNRFGSMPQEKRDADLRYVLELVVNSLRAEIRELRLYGRPTQVPKPVKREIA
jgi:hypothetical protein